MKENFEQSLEWLNKDLASLPDKPRGPHGVTVAVLKSHYGHAQVFDLCQIEAEKAKDLARMYYWYATGCDDLPPGVDYCAFVMAVACDNSFLVRRWVSGGDVGQWRAVTEGPIDAERDRQIVTTLGESLLQRLRFNPKWPQCYQNWTQLVQRTRRRAFKLVEAPPPSQ